VCGDGGLRHPSHMEKKVMIAILRGNIAFLACVDVPRRV